MKFGIIVIFIHVYVYMRMVIEKADFVNIFFDGRRKKEGKLFPGAPAN